MLLKFIGFDGREMAQERIRSALASEGWLAALASGVVLLWGASNVFAELQGSMNTIWEVQLRPDLGWRETIRRRFLSVTTAFFAAIS